MFIDQVLDAGAMPTLARAMQFAARRQDLISHNIANISTPNFIQTDVSTEKFQAQLAQAVDDRRERTGGTRGAMELRSTREVSAGANGTLRLTPLSHGDGVLFHDRNNRDLERLMQDMVENMSAFRVASDLLRSQMGTLMAAITETA